MLAETRISVNWGGFSMVKAMLAGADLVCNYLGDGDHVIFLSGHCFPIKPISQLESYLAKVPWKQHILAFDSDFTGMFSKRRWHHKYWFDLNLFPKKYQMLRRISRKALYFCTYMISAKSPAHIRVAIGSQWIALTKECYIDIRKRIVSAEFAYLRNSFAPDEMIFHSAVYSSKSKYETQFETLQTSLSEKVSQFANLHLLDENLTGEIAGTSLEDVKEHHFFIRKVTSPNFDLFYSIFGHKLKEGKND